MSGNPCIHGNATIRGVAPLGRGASEANSCAVGNSNRWDQVSAYRRTYCVWLHERSSNDVVRASPRWPQHWGHPFSSNLTAFVQMLSTRTRGKFLVRCSADTTAAW